MVSKINYKVKQMKKERPRANYVFVRGHLAMNWHSRLLRHRGEQVGRDRFARNCSQSRSAVIPSAPVIRKAERPVGAGILNVLNTTHHFVCLYLKLFHTSNFLLRMESFRPRARDGKSHQKHNTRPCKAHHGKNPPHGLSPFDLKCGNRADTAQLSYLYTTQYKTFCQEKNLKKRLGFPVSHKLLFDYCFNSMKRDPDAFRVAVSTKNYLLLIRALGMFYKPTAVGLRYSNHMIRSIFSYRIPIFTT